MRRIVKEVACAGGRSRRSTVRTPYGGEIRRKKFRSSVQNYGTAVSYSNLRNRLSRHVETFRCDTIRSTGLRPQRGIYCLNTWMIHCGVIVSHAGHGL